MKNLKSLLLLPFFFYATDGYLKAFRVTNSKGPIQFFVKDTGSALTDADARAIVDLGSADTRLTMMLTSGEPVPDPDIGGP